VQESLKSGCGAAERDSVMENAKSKPNYFYPALIVLLSLAAFLYAYCSGMRDAGKYKTNQTNQNTK
jgi:hypothetical protein